MKFCECFVNSLINIVYKFEFGDIVYRDSKTCFKCGADNKYPRSIISESGRVFPSFGVLSCQNLSCGITMNRDANGARNIHHLLYNHLNDLARPTWLKRSSKSTISTVGGVVTSVDSS